MEDIDIKDVRADNLTSTVKGEFTKYETNNEYLFIWVSTGYMVRIRLKALQPIVDDLVSKEVLNRLKGKEDAG